MADSRNEIRNEQHILPPAFYSPIGQGQKVWEKVKEGAIFTTA